MYLGIGVELVAALEHAETDERLGLLAGRDDVLEDVSCQPVDSVLRKTFIISLSVLKQSKGYRRNHLGGHLGVWIHKYWFFSTGGPIWSVKTSHHIGTCISVICTYGGK